MDSRGRAAPAWVSGRRPPHPSSPSGTESSGQGSPAALGIRRRLCTGEDVAGVMRLSLPVHTVVTLRPPEDGETAHSAREDGQLLQPDVYVWRLAYTPRA